MTFTTAASDLPRRTSLATADLPDRVRRTLDRALMMVSEELDHGMERMLLEFERELFRLADQARHPTLESGYMQALHSFRLNRADLLPQFMIEVESALAGLRSSAEPQPAKSADDAPLSFRNLSLVEESVMDEDTVLREVASRQEGRSTLALHLLGQRFGVLAGAPAFDSVRLPLGPHALCRAIHTAAVALEITHDARLLLYRMFDRQLMAGYPQLLDRMNQLLVDEGILPALTFVPIRGSRPAPTAVDRANQDPDVPASADTASTRRAPGTRPHTAWLGEAPGADAQDDDESAFAMFQQLLSGRRELIDKLRADTAPGTRQQLNTTDLIQALQGLQALPAASRGNLAEIKRTVLARARQQHGQASTLLPEDNDTFELVGLLYDQIESEIRTDAPTTPLVRELQLPLLRLALRDRGFFLHPGHPARQLLNTIAESAARWSARDELDQGFVQSLRQTVEEVVSGFDDDPTVFSRANDSLQQQVHAQIRKAETLEKRHIEAAQGKEKLEAAKLQAAQVLEETVGDQRLPRFVRALLNQAWADVLTLTLLRQGEDSEAWRNQLDATAQIVRACAREGGPAVPELTGLVEASLSQVGYHAEEAAVIAQRLTGSIDESDEDPTSRTELAMKLKARVRLGEEKVREKKAPLPPRTALEQAHYDQLRVLPFGSWIEFVTNQQGHIVRRRLSWYSRITDNALFVNQRGQRVGEQSLDSLARLMAADQARLVTAERGRLVDRAWQAAVSALRSFAGRGDNPHTTKATA
ncbi:DUF1631 family protein [Luteimonas sp. A478]